MNFNTDWLYSPYDYANGYEVGLNEDSFEAVCIPHANKILDEYKGNDFQAQIDSYRFISWYRRHFKLDPAYADKKIYVEFEGVATVADVYINGKLAGTHKGAYTGFVYDITDYVNADGSDNVIAVRVDSTKHSDIPPEGGNVDYCLFGGIVRNVNMIAAEKIHISDVTITTPSIRDGDSSTNFDVVIDASMPEENHTGKDSAEVETLIKAADGTLVASACQALSLKNGENKVTITANDADVKLWSISEPNLYTAEIRIKSEGECLDSFSVKFGYRWFEFAVTASESAFYLNGEKLVIRGINRHEQWPWLGRAANDKLQAADADLIKDTGLNAVRCSHYPQSRAFLDRCDEIGLLVIEEAPGWQHIGGADWQEIYLENLVEMVTRDKNHPSIISWGVRVNESFDDHVLYEKSNKLVKGLDPTRPTHASRRMETYEDSECQEDIYAVNYTYPVKVHTTPFIITEHSMDWFHGNGFPGADSGKAATFIQSFAEPMNYYYNNKWCSGGFGWSMFDYNNEVNYTNTGNVFYSGIYDIFRYEKPAAYLYRSQKNPSEEIVLYIAHYWAEDHNREVMVLSNCDEVELFVNGKSIGKNKPDAYTELPHPVYLFKNVTFEEGEIKAVGYIGGKKVKTHTRFTPKNASRMVVTPDYTELAADGSDITNVMVELKDENGTLLPYDTSKVTIETEGPGKFIGQQEIALEGGHIAFMVQSLYKQTGTIKCRVKLSEGSIAGECTIEAVVMDDSSCVPASEYEDGNIAPEAAKQNTFHYNL